MINKYYGKIMELIYSGITPSQYCKFQHHQLRLKTVNESKFTFKFYLTNFVWE